MKLYPFDRFWDKHPALYYGLFILLGSLFTLKSPYPLLPACLLISKNKFPTACFCFLLPTVLLYQFYAFPEPNERFDGVFVIHTIQPSCFASHRWDYSGTLYTQDGKLSCKTSLGARLNPKRMYHVKGRLRKTQNHTYLLKTESDWIPGKKRFSFADWRLQAQKKILRYIQSHYSEKAASFLSGMIMGHLSDKVLRRDFSLLGLSHLLVISGFHFATFSLLLHLCLRLLLPLKLEAVVMMVLLTGYFIFVGPSPSVLRAWIAIMIFFLSKLLERNTSSLNILGCALIISLIINPLSAIDLGFQLSFLATAGILFFYPIFQSTLSLWIPKYPLTVAVEKSLLWQHGYILISFLKEAMALNLAVQLSLLPLQLHYFNQFCFNTFIYNLVCPLFASICLIFFILSAFLFPVAHKLNDLFCNLLLQLIEEPPLTFPISYCPPLPLWLLTISLTLLLMIALSVRLLPKNDT